MEKQGWRVLAFCLVFGLTGKARFDTLDKHDAELDVENQGGGMDVRPLELKIKPDALSGFQDFLPGEMIVRQQMLARIQDVYERYGFVPIDTPTIERWNVITGKNPSSEMNIFEAKIMAQNSKPSDDTVSTEEGETLRMALRFDLTVPLAAYFSRHPNDLPRPFKRYAYGKVFRGEKARAGRFREFAQFDADIVGSSSVLADVEIISIMHDVLLALGVDQFVIRFNTRKILNGLATMAHFDRHPLVTAEVMRAIDKLEKVGEDEVINLLKRQPDSRFDEGAPNLSDEDVQRILSFLRIAGSPEAMIGQCEQLFSGNGVGLEGVEELRALVSGVRAVGIPEHRWALDLSVARGLDYYTGPVFETTLTELPQIGSVFSGGRFDDLLDRFGSGRIPSVGASIGVDRLFDALRRLGKVKTRPTMTDVLIVNFVPALHARYLSIAAMLRSEGIRCEIYVGEEKDFKSQLTYGVKQQIPVLLILGPDEDRKRVVQIKDMDRRSQVETPLDNLLKVVQDILGSRM